MFEALVVSCLNFISMTVNKCISMVCCAIRNALLEIDDGIAKIQDEAN